MVWNKYTGFMDNLQVEIKSSRRILADFWGTIQDRLSSPDAIVTRVELFWNEDTVPFSTQMCN